MIINFYEIYHRVQIQGLRVPGASKQDVLNAFIREKKPQNISLKFCRDLSKAPFSKPFNISYGVSVILVFIASLKRNDNYLTLWFSLEPG